jgi:hypothetical protein
MYVQYGFLSLSLAQINSAGCTIIHCTVQFVRKRERVRKKMGMEIGKKGPAGSSSRGEPDAKHLTLRHRTVDTSYRAHTISNKGRRWKTMTTYSNRVTL